MQICLLTFDCCHIVFTSILSQPFLLLLAARDLLGQQLGHKVRRGEQASVFGVEHPWFTAILQFHLDSIAADFLVRGFDVIPFAGLVLHSAGGWSVCFYCLLTAVVVRP